MIGRQRSANGKGEKVILPVSTRKTMSISELIDFAGLFLQRVKFLRFLLRFLEKNGENERRRNFVRPMRGRGCFRNENFQPMRVEACFQLGKSPQPPPLKTTEEKGSNYTRKNGETAIFEILSRAFSLRQHFGFGRFFPKVTKNNSSKFFQKFQVLDNYVAFLFYFSEGKLRRFA